MTAEKTPADLIVRTHTNGVTTLRMNNPRRLNGWTADMMEALKAGFRREAEDANTHALILTGTDPYYSAGVNLSGTIQMAHPKVLHQGIEDHNRALFEAFLNFPKPILAAVNGPAIGACVTSATLCNAILASDKATFSTPFAALGVPPEGCSSVMFAALMGEDTAQRMLGEEGWKPTGTEAAQAGLADATAPHDELLAQAQTLAEQWVANGVGRTYRGGFSREDLVAVNARESREVADAFLSAPFLEAQYRFLRRKKKHVPAATFFALWKTRPVWSRWL